MDHRTHRQNDLHCGHFVVVSISWIFLTPALVACQGARGTMTTSLCVLYICTSPSEYTSRVNVEPVDIYVDTVLVSVTRVIPVFLFLGHREFRQFGEALKYNLRISLLRGELACSNVESQKVYGLRGISYLMHGIFHVLATDVHTGFRS